MTFCYAPWTNLEILTSGDILPCCKFQPQLYQERFNIVEHSIQDYRNSNMLETVKQQFMQGNWPRGCERCKIEEANHIPSKRQLDQERWQQHYDAYKLDSNQLLTVSMAFGNTCNLKCIICSSTASSKWRQEELDLYGTAATNIESVRKTVIDSIATIAPNLTHLDIHGGEPFLSGIDQHHQLLDHYINIGQSKEITLHYTTNGSIFPNADWQSRWQHYKSIDLQISIDGVGPRYEYLRYPASWATLCDNISQFQLLRLTNRKFSVSIAHTVSAYNVLYLDEFIDWCQTKKLPRPWLGKLHWPAHLQPGVWPAAAKKFIIDKLNNSNHHEVQSWAKLLSTTDNSLHFDQFCNYTQLHDQYRDLDFTKTFPELKIFYETSNHSNQRRSEHQDRGAGS